MKADLMMRFGLRALDISGLPQLILAFKRRRAAVLLYHGISDESGAGLYNYRRKFISPGAFREQIAWLKRRYTVLPLSELPAVLAGESSLPERSVFITFDDGYRNNFTHAFPILAQAGIPATFFIATRFVDEREPLPVDVVEYSLGTTQKTEIALSLGDKSRTFLLRSREERIAADRFLRAWIKRSDPAAVRRLLADIVNLSGRNLADELDATPYRPMTWEDITNMEARGMSFAAHTHSHAILSAMASDGIEDEIARSTAIITKRVRRPSPVFAYPNGSPADFTPAMRDILRRYGYVASLTTIPGTVAAGSDSFALPRYVMDRVDSLYLFRTAIAGIRDAGVRLMRF